MTKKNTKPTTKPQAPRKPTTAKGKAQVTTRKPKAASKPKAAPKATKPEGSEIDLGAVTCEANDPAQVQGVRAKLTPAQRKAARKEKRMARRALRKANRRAEQAKTLHRSLGQDQTFARDMAAKIVAGTAGAKTERLVAMAWAMTTLGR